MGAVLVKDVKISAEARAKALRRAIAGTPRGQLLLTPGQRRALAAQRAAGQPAPQKP